MEFLLAQGSGPSGNFQCGLFAYHHDVTADNLSSHLQSNRNRNSDACILLSEA